MPKLTLEIEIDDIGTDALADGEPEILDLIRNAITDLSLGLVQEGEGRVGNTVVRYRLS